MVGRYKFKVGRRLLSVDVVCETDNNTTIYKIIFSTLPTIDKVVNYLTMKQFIRDGKLIKIIPIIPIRKLTKHKIVMYG
jgi:hypothetical protein